MNKITAIILLLLTTAFLYGCSADREEEKQGKIDTMTKEIGQEAVRMIKTPIDKAQAVADQEEKRARELDERGNQ